MARADADHLEIHRSALECFGDLLPEEVQSEFSSALRQLIQEYEAELARTALAMSYAHHSNAVVRKAKAQHA